nr:J526 [uncultured bacterium]
MEARKVTDDITIIASYAEFPGYGYVPANAFVLKAAQPVLIDTGMVMESAIFQDTLRSVIDPQDLRWLFLTHPHPDHIGSLKALLDEVPHLRLVTTFMGFGLLSLTEEISLDRLYMLNPGETLDVGDRQLAAIKPPTYDDPSTTGFLDTKSRALFSSDSFGALLPAAANFAEEVRLDELLQGQRLWTTMDSPWLHNIDQQRFGAQLKAIGALEPSWILSSHLPPASTLTQTFLESLASVPDSEPFVGPNQPALEAMLAQMGQVVPA